MFVSVSLCAFVCEFVCVCVSLVVCVIVFVHLFNAVIMRSMVNSVVWQNIMKAADGTTQKCLMGLMRLIGLKCTIDIHMSDNKCIQITSKPGVPTCTRRMFAR